MRQRQKVEVKQTGSGDEAQTGSGDQIQSWDEIQIGYGEKKRKQTRNTYSTDKIKSTGEKNLVI